MRRGDSIVPPQTQSQARESADERDARLELRWHYDRMGEQSTLAFVSVYQADLATQFFEWRRLHAGGDMRDAIVTWERARFGDELDRVSHSLLAFAVRTFLAPEDGGRRTYTRAVPRDVDQLAIKAAKGHAMPARMSHRAVDERVRTLEGQAQAIVDAPGDSVEENPPPAHETSTEWKGEL